VCLKSSVIHRLSSGEDRTADIMLQYTLTADSSGKVAITGTRKNKYIRL